MLLDIGCVKAEGTNGCLAEVGVLLGASGIGQSKDAMKRLRWVAAMLGCFAGKPAPDRRGESVVILKLLEVWLSGDGESGYCMRILSRDKLRILRMHSQS